MTKPTAKRAGYAGAHHAQPPKQQGRGAEYVNAYDQFVQYPVLLGDGSILCGRRWSFLLSRLRELFGHTEPGGASMHFFPYRVGLNASRMPKNDHVIEDIDAFLD